MPNIDKDIILELENLAINQGPTYTYSGLSGIDNNRTHASQVEVLFYYTHFQNGNPVSNYTWDNWYDPYVLPVKIDNGPSVLRFDQSTQRVTLQNVGLVEKTPIEGTSGLFLPDFINGDSVTIRRSQRISKPLHTFGAGSRITSTALNNAIAQLFDSLQELEDRVVKLESE